MDLLNQPYPRKTNIRCSKGDDLFLGYFLSHEWKFDSQNERDQYMVWDNNNIYDKYLYHLMTILSLVWYGLHCLSK